MTENRGRDVRPFLELLESGPARSLSLRLQDPRQEIERWRAHLVSRRAVAATVAVRSPRRPRDRRVDRSRVRGRRERRDHRPARLSSSQRNLAAGAVLGQDSAESAGAGGENGRSPRRLSARLLRRDHVLGPSRRRCGRSATSSWPRPFPRSKDSWTAASSMRPSACSRPRRSSPASSLPTATGTR